MNKLENDIVPESDQAFAKYILELEREYQPWYDASSNRWKVIWGIGQGTALMAGITASVVAAIADQAALQKFGWIKAALILLPALGAFAASTIGQMRAREILALREKGRATMQNLIARAKADYAAAGGDLKKLSELHFALLAEVDHLENGQATEIISLAAGAVVSQNQQGIFPPVSRQQRLTVVDSTKEEGKPGI